MLRVCYNYRPSAIDDSQGVYFYSVRCFAAHHWRIQGVTWGPDPLKKSVGAPNARHVQHQDQSAECLSH